MKQHFSTQSGNAIISDLIYIIISNREYLSDIDGATGDGDHGINMSKGFAMCGDAIKGKTLTLAEGFDAISDALMEGIGGSMGPLYGSFFLGMANSVRGKDVLNEEDFHHMLENGLSELQDISSAKVGDKCLMDSLIPAVHAFGDAVNQGASFEEALSTMKVAAQQGRDSTLDLVSKIGRSSRLGERSRGVLDAGATSCCLLLCQMADSVNAQLNPVPA